MNDLSGIWLSDRGPALRVLPAIGTRRATGLIGRPPLSYGEALLFTRCRSVHGMFMRRRVAVIFLDDGLYVRRTAVLRPWRIVFCKQAVHVLEMRDGECERLGLQAGDRFFASPSERRRARTNGRAAAATFVKEKI
ncbi:MAG: DUF192 domain-containing protein [Actinobacteria bacterium]|nr:DUF192 domain-containing protein [Actinomycetota bacterium]